MNAKQNEPKLTYALDTSGKMVSIHDVLRGKRCNCRCPKCNQLLDAKLGHGRRQPHFAHQIDSDCHGSYMTALHMLAEQIICQKKAVRAPAYKVIEEQTLKFKQVSAEIRIERNDIQPDIRGISEDDNIWYIEIRNTNEVDDKKREKLINSNISCLEIDVSEQSLENLETFLLNSSDNREWINNPNYEEQIAANNRKRVNIVEKALFESKKLLIPPYDNFESREIIFDTIILEYKQDDGLYTRIKCTTTDAENFTIDICLKDNLKEIKNYISSHSECAGFIICVDNIPLINEFSYNDLYFEGLYEIETPPEKQSLSNDTLKDTLEEHYWTIKEYDKQLQKGIYITDSGIDTSIIMKEIVDQKILVLYCANIDDAPCCLYHVGIVEVHDGKIIKRKLGDYVHESEAVRSFKMRVNIHNQSKVH